MALIKFINPASKYKWFNLLWIIAMFLFPIVLWLLPANLFDNTGFELCPSKALLNYDCPGCGMTRAIMHLHHFEWAEAFYYNYGIVVIYPALIILWFYWLHKARKRHLKFLGE